MVFPTLCGAARKRAAGPPIVLAGRHGVAGGGPSQNFLVFPTCRGAARLPGQGRSCNLQDICVLPVVEWWTFPRFTGSRRCFSCHFHRICFAHVLQFLEPGKVSRFARQWRGQSCHLAGICFATLFWSLWRCAPCPCKAPQTADQHKLRRPRPSADGPSDKK